MSTGPLRILVVAAREPWPLNSGGRLHLFHVLRELSRRAAVTLALPQPPLHAEQLPPDVRVTVMDASAATPQPPPPDSRAVGGLTARWTAQHFGHAPHVAAFVARAAQPATCDVLLLNGAHAGQYAPCSKVPVVWNPQDELVLHTVRDVTWRQWYRWPNALRRAVLYAAFERWVSRQAHNTIYVSSVDARCARRWSRRARLTVIANGVDLDYFSPPVHAPVPGTVTFVGSLEFPPNVDGITRFAQDVWPALHARDRRRRLVVVGRQPVPEVRALRDIPGIELHADVPDVRPYLAAAAVVIVPTRKGGGLKNKILEAAAMQRPLVVSPRALGGLSASPGRELLVAPTRRAWITQLDQLLRDPPRAARLAAAALRWVRAHHRWEHTGDQFFAVLAAAAGQLRDIPPLAIGSPPRRARPGAPTSAPREVAAWH